MTISEKILAAHCGRSEVKPGELIEARLDFVFANDITGPMSIRVFKDAGGERVFDPERVAMIPDHFVPNKDIQSAVQAKDIREFALAQKLPHYFEVGRMGIDHTTQKRYESKAIPPFMRELLSAGGLVPHVRSRYGLVGDL